LSWDSLLPLNAKDIPLIAELSCHVLCRVRT
ncbi:hypothetical protein ALC62_14638, partial [Cyphomyrmex costatus]